MVVWVLESVCLFVAVCVCVGECVSLWVCVCLLVAVWLSVWVFDCIWVCVFLSVCLCDCLTPWVCVFLCGWVYRSIFVSVRETERVGRRNLLILDDLSQTKRWSWTSAHCIHIPCLIFSYLNYIHIPCLIFLYLNTNPILSIRPPFCKDSRAKWYRIVVRSISYDFTGEIWYCLFTYSIFELDKKWFIACPYSAWWLS